jgi:hypothetical protein
MDGQYNMERPYNAYQQSQKQEMSIEEAIKVVIREGLKYFGRVGINIDNVYGIIATGDGRYQIRRIGPKEEYAIHIDIPDILKKATAEVLGKPFNLDGILYELLKELKGVTMVVGRNPEIYITQKNYNGSY